mmetsp:Transcript_9458/g.33477  ORF Transcript_9458/g.33477 Transcript_9458/m.33477 type:complete len:302 (-) Transcript_9458:138-1043(-)
MVLLLLLGRKGIPLPLEVLRTRFPLLLRGACWHGCGACGHGLPRGLHSPLSALPLHCGFVLLIKGVGCTAVGDRIHRCDQQARFSSGLRRQGFHGALPHLSDGLQDLAQRLHQLQPFLQLHGQRHGQLQLGLDAPPLQLHLLILQGRVLILQLLLGIEVLRIVRLGRHQSRLRRCLCSGHSRHEAIELHGLPVELRVALDHHRLEEHEVVNAKQLLDELLVELVVAIHATCAEACELLRRHAELDEVGLQEFVHQQLEPIVYQGILELVLVLILEDAAIVVHEAGDGRDPGRGSEDGGDEA